MRWLAAACATLMLVGCARFGLDRGQKYSRKLKKVDVKKVPVKGFGVHIVYRQKNLSSVDGELLAVGPDFLYVMMKKEKIFRAPRRWVRAVHIWLYRSPWGGLLGWTGLGAAASISHGGFMMFTIPTWILASAIITPLVAYEGRLKFTQKTLGKLFQYARFPAGIPKGFYAAHMCRTKKRMCPRPPPRTRQPPRVPPAKRPSVAPPEKRRRIAPPAMRSGPAPIARHSGADDRIRTVEWRAQIRYSADTRR